MQSIIDIRQLNKTYPDKFQALKAIDLSINRGEIFALLGPNGAGKTTLISILCSVINPTSGTVTVDGLDLLKDYRAVRQQIGVVPQELSLGMFENVWNTVAFSRGLYGQPPDDAYLESLLKDLSLLDKKHHRVMTLSGGMKRRVLIAKALAHQPKILFLDEPTAGVDVELRRDMWRLIHRLRNAGVTIILTTHYIEEAEEMADRIGIINKGEIILVEQKHQLMEKLGRKQITLELARVMETLPPALAQHPIQLSSDGTQIIYTYQTAANDSQVSSLLQTLHETGVEYRDIHTRQSSLEEIFVGLVEEKA